MHNEQPLIRRKLNSLFENGVQGKTNAGITKCPASRIERDTLAGQLFCLRYVVIVPRINGVLESPSSTGLVQRVNVKLFAQKRVAAMVFQSSHPDNSSVYKESLNVNVCSFRHFYHWYPLIRSLYSLLLSCIITLRVIEDKKDVQRVFARVEFRFSAKEKYEIYLYFSLCIRWRNRVSVICRSTDVLLSFYFFLRKK